MRSSSIDSFAIYDYEDCSEISLTADGKFIIVRSEEGAVYAFENSCLHQGSRFKVVEGERLVCPVHGWELDPTSGDYKIPIGSRCTQEKLRVEQISNCQIKVYLPESKNTNPPRELIAKDSLECGEMSITHINHACAIFKLGEYRIATDPWCVGPAFVRGWWLLTLHLKTG